MSIDRLRRELSRLRETHAAASDCKACKTHPMYETWAYWEVGEDFSPEDPEPCPECGRMPEVIPVGWEERVEPEEALFVVVFREKGHTRPRAARTASKGFEPRS
jgi:hypothetical protein